MRRALCWSAVIIAILLPLSCSLPRLGGELFACTTDADCEDGRICRAGFCRGRATGTGQCLPTTCAAEGLDCGELNDLCSPTPVSCGRCTSPDSCGGGGTPGRCGCTPETDVAFCAARAAQCGLVMGVDSCGRGRSVGCGTCAAPMACGGAGVPNVCGCTDALACEGRCGTLTDACGRSRDCGATCAGLDWCGGGGVANRCGKSWPTGAQGPLVIRTGESLRIDAGVVLDFSSITIDPGGALVIAPGAAWTMLGSRGPVVINGRIVAEPIEGGDRFIVSNEPVADGSLTGPQLIHHVVQAAGGAGGRTELCPGVRPARGGDPRDGNGGGGSGGWQIRTTDCSSYGLGPDGDYQRLGADAGVVEGGTGGIGGYGPPRARAAGSTTPTMPGGTAGNRCDPDVGCCGGDGGGGGFRGRHGQALFISTHSSISGSGEIDVRGEPGSGGGAGGVGTPGLNPWRGVGGSGGGGGAGGAGGSVVLRHKAGLTGVRVLRTGGSGGSGGMAGSSAAGVVFNGEPGTSGPSGVLSENP